MKSFNQFMNEAKFTTDQYLPTSTVDNIINVVGGNSDRFWKKVEKGIIDYLNLTVGEGGSVQNVRLVKHDINGVMFSSGQVRLWVNEVTYTFDIDKTQQKGGFRNQEIWINI